MVLGKTFLFSDKVFEMLLVFSGLSFEEFFRFVDLEGEEFVFGVCKEEMGFEDEEGVREDVFAFLFIKVDVFRVLGTLRRWLECYGIFFELFEKFYVCEEEVERFCCL